MSKQQTLRTLEDWVKACQYQGEVKVIIRAKATGEEVETSIDPLFVAWACGGGVVKKIKENLGGER